MAIERPFAHSSRRPIDSFPDLCHDWRSESHIWDEVAIHDIDVKPVSSAFDGVNAFLAQLSEVCRQDRRGDDGRRRHGGWCGRFAER